MVANQERNVDKAVDIARLVGRQAVVEDVGG
jgi:hypothetical protein